MADEDSSVYSGSVQTMTTAENHNSSTIALDCRVQETTPVCCKTPNQTYNSKNNPEDLLEEFTGKLNAIVKHCPASDFYHRTGTTQSQCNVKDFTSCDYLFADRIPSVCDDDASNDCKTKRRINLKNNSCDTGATMDNNEIEYMKEQLEIDRKREQYLLNVNFQLQAELDKSIQTNMLLEQCVTCPYIVDNKGEIKFPGKSDLDKKFEYMSRALINVKNDLKTAQNVNCLAAKLDKVLRLPLPRCSDHHCCNK